MSGTVPGVLYIVATPIGHLGDLGIRALETLKVVGLIAAEDTRHSARLLRHYGVTTPCTPLHEHNERAAVARLLARLEQGEAVALVSDAGTPLISDPGYHLVRAAQDRGIRVAPIPGPSALAAALSVAGQAIERFVFEGFLPPREAARRRRLEWLRNESRSLVFLEAPHRVADTLAAMVAVFGAAREATLARELTKIHETVLRLPLGVLAARVAGDPEQQRGEIVLIIQGAPEVDAGLERAREVLVILLRDLPLRRAAQIAAELTGVGRNRLYELGLELQRSSGEGS